VSNKKVSRINKHESLAPHLALLGVQLLFGTWPLVGKFVLRTLPSTGLAALRVCGAALIFLLLRQIRGTVQIKDKSDYLKLLVFSLLGVVFNQLLFLKGLSLTTVINATILSATIPVFALIVGAIIGNDHLSFIKIVGIILAALGVVYLVDPMQADFSGGYALGNLLLVMNAFCYGSYIAISKNVIRRIGTLTSISWIFFFAAILTLPIGFYSLDATTLSTTTPTIWLAILYIVIFPTVGAYFLNAWALVRVAPSVVAVYIYLQPLIAFVLAPYFLGEKWNSRAWVAMALIFSGLFFVTRQKKQIEIETTIP
jgi:drug/metabolite transporter (DMT)-like permease